MSRDVTPAFVTALNVFGMFYPSAIANAVASSEAAVAVVPPKAVKAAPAEVAPVPPCAMLSAVVRPDRLVMSEFAPEAAAEMVVKLLKESLARTFRRKLGAALCMSAFRELKQSIDYADIGADER